MAERLKSIAGVNDDPTAEVLKQQMAHRPSVFDVKTKAKEERRGVSNTKLTGASQLTLKQSLLPCALVTILFFLWGFAYGLLDVLYVAAGVHHEVSRLTHSQKLTLSNSARYNAGSSCRPFGSLLWRVFPRPADILGICT